MVLTDLYTTTLHWRPKDVGVRRWKRWEGTNGDWGWAKLNSSEDKGKRDVYCYGDQSKGM
jgi:hypothetical protein